MNEQSDRLWNLTEEKRARLLDPAEAEFIDHGFERASMNRILATAKMSKGQAYYYITGKSDLYLAVCTRSFAPLFDYADARTKKLADVPDFWIGVEALAGGLAEFLAGDEKLSALALGVYGSTSATESLAPLAVKLDEILERIIRLGQASGEIRTDLPEGLIVAVLKGLTRSIDRWFALNAPSLSPHEMELASRGTFEMVRNLVRPPAEESNDA